METKENQINDFKKAFSLVKSEIPLVCVCGNHDIGDAPTVETINKYRNRNNYYKPDIFRIINFSYIFRYRSDFGDDYFSFWCRGVFFIVLNSQYYKDPTHVPHLAEEQEQWLDGQLSSAAGSRIICFSHIPWFIHKHDEEENKIFNIKPDIRQRMLDKLYNAGKPKFISTLLF